MSEAAQAAEPEVIDEAPQKGADQAAPDASGETDESIEQEALAMGWKPESQFKGPTDKFVSAAEYVERGKTIMPFLKKELAGAYKKIEGLEKAVGSAVRHISKAKQEGYEQRSRELQAELDAAAAAGNAADVRAITKDIVDLEREVAAAPKEEASDEPAEMVAWREANPWYGVDEAHSAACDAIGAAVFKDGYTGKAQIAEVDKRMREKFPGLFAKVTNPNRTGPAAVEGGGVIRPKSGKSYADLPAEAKQMCDEFVRDIRGFTRDKFVKDYQW